MSTTTRHRTLPKANGTWFSHMVTRGEQQALDKGQVILDMAQDSATEILNSSSKLAKKASSKAVTFGKAHPIKVALGGIAVGFVLAAKLFRK